MPLLFPKVLLLMTINYKKQPSFPKKTNAITSDTFLTLALKSQSSHARKGHGKASSLKSTLFWNRNLDQDPAVIQITLPATATADAKTLNTLPGLATATRIY